MGRESAELDLIESLSEIPFRYQDRNAALKRIAELGRQKLEAQACTLVFFDLMNRQMTQVACASLNKEFEAFMAGFTFKLGSTANDSFINFDLIAQGEAIERDNLELDGGGAFSQGTTLLVPA